MYSVYFEKHARRREEALEKSVGILIPVASIVSLLVNLKYLSIPFFSSDLLVFFAAITSWLRAESRFPPLIGGKHAAENCLLQHEHFSPLSFSHFNFNCSFFSEAGAILHTTHFMSLHS